MIGNTLITQVVPNASASVDLGTVTNPWNSLALKHTVTGSLPAAASHEGSIRYDVTTKTMKWSNGTVWATI